MNNKNTILFIILLILVMFFSLYMLSIVDTKEEVYHKEYIPINEVGDFNKYLSDNLIEFNSIIINSYLENNTFDNIDLLNTKNKILFTFKHILKDENNYNKFLVLDNKKFENVDKAPTEKDVLSYMYFSDFKKEYESLFNEELNIKDRDVSKYNTDFDKTNLYIYYKNNNTKYKIANILCDNNTIDDNYIITASIKIELNDELKKKVKKDNIEAIIRYTYLKDDVVQLISFQTKASN
jgi:hypothetical protein